MIQLQEHYIPIVAISYLIAAASAYAAGALAGRSRSDGGRAGQAWLAAGAGVLGFGIWSMYFIGLFAFRPAAAMPFDPLLALLAGVCSVLSCWAALRLVTRGRVAAARIAIAALLLGGGMLAMHRTGLSAIGGLRHGEYGMAHWLLFAVLALVASAASAAWLRRCCAARASRRSKLAAAAGIGLALCGLHYAGPAAIRFVSERPSGGLAAAPGQSDMALLAAAAAGAFLMLAAAWVALLLDKKALKRLAFSDAATGLPNRHRLARHFETAFARYRNGFLLFIDFDRFKMINDTAGYDAGDLVLADVARRLRTPLRGEQAVFRFGGDEFLIVGEGSRAEAETLAATLLEELSRPLYLHGHEIYLSASVGISLAPRHGKDRSTLLKSANMAMYSAKASGGGHYRVFDAQTSRLMQRKLELEKGLRKAMQLNEFDIHYQPKWDAAAGRLTGLEALMRWRHGKLGAIPPSEFIPIAEETGLIVGMTRWMMREACLQNAAWQREGLPKVRVSVNMSIRVFESGQLGDMVREALSASGMDPTDLELEITESIAMRDIEGTIRQLLAVKALGVSVSMDDFGTGYSSLGNIDRIPIDTLKIDQTFIRQIEVPSKQAIISTIITMAGHLKLDVVAEGVETEEQIRFLRSRGCNIMQGYYYGKPMHPDRLREWVLTA